MSKKVTKKRRFHWVILILNGFFVLSLLSLAAWGLYVEFEKRETDRKVVEELPNQKSRFIYFILRYAQAANQHINQQREKLLSLSLMPHSQISEPDRRWLASLADQYKLANFDFKHTKSWEELLKRVDIVPNSLVVAQAIEESGWGRSRFARQGYNYFGLWCFRQDCGIVPADRDPRDIHEIQIFSDPQEAVSKYMLNMNTLSAYVQLRELRKQLRDRQSPITGKVLYSAIATYSTRREDYVSDIEEILESYHLYQFDEPVILFRIPERL